MKKHRITQQEADTIRRVAKELEKYPAFAPTRNSALYTHLAELYGTNRHTVRRVLDGDIFTKKR